MKPLFELAAQYRELAALEASDELAPEVIADTLEGIVGDFETKSVAIAKFILSLEAKAEGIDAAAEAMAARAARLAKRAESIRQYLLLQFQTVDFKKIETDELIVSRRNNPPAVRITDESVVPEEFWVQPETPPKRIDKDAIKLAIKSGKSIHGCYLDSGERIEIRL